MPNAIIIHGTKGNPEMNWFPWLKRELETRGFNVIVPRMPTPNGQSLDSWTKEFKQYKKYLNKDSIVVGHSLAPAFLMNVIENLNKPIRSAFFVSVFLGLLGNEEYDNLNKTFTTQKFNWKKIRQNCKRFYILNGDNDPYVPLERGKEVADKLSAELTVVHNGGHLNYESGYTEFPLLLEKIRWEFSIYRDWEKIYSTKSTPWDVGEAEDVLVQLVQTGSIKPCRVLELGCGHGNDSIFLAKNGFDVTAVDISKKAITEAKRRAKNAKVKARFIADDASKLKQINGKFDFVYDRACFHFVYREDREAYIRNVSRLLKTGGDFVLIASSDKETVKGPYQFSPEDIRNLFGRNFEIKEIRLITLEKHKEKPQPYLCVMKRR